MKNKTSIVAFENGLLLGLTFHNVSASLVSEFAKRIVIPYYGGNLNAAIQDLLSNALAEQNFVLSHITHVKVKGKQQLT
jgi:hypothetical protein